MNVNIMSAQTFNDKRRPTKNLEFSLLPNAQFSKKKLFKSSLSRLFQNIYRHSYAPYKDVRAKLAYSAVCW